MTGRQQTSVQDFGGGNDLAGQAFREIWQSRDRGNPVKLQKSFLSMAPDSYVDFVIEEVERSSELLKTWPSGAVLEVEMRGDSGSYCESDTRSVALTFKINLGGETKVFRTSCGLREFKQQFTHNLQRVTKLLSII